MNQNKTSKDREEIEKYLDLLEGKINSAIGRNSTSLYDKEELKKLKDKWFVEYLIDDRIVEFLISDVKDLFKAKDEEIERLLSELKRYRTDKYEDVMRGIVKQRMSTTSD